MSSESHDQVRDASAGWPEPREATRPLEVVEPGYGVVPALSPQGVQPQFQAYPAVVAPKNPVLSLILSFFIPGLGTMVNGKAGKGVAILLLYLVGVALSFVLIGIPIAIGVWIRGMVDAHKSARQWNRAHGIIG